MHIQILTKSGNFETMDTSRLIRACGFVSESDENMTELFGQITECYPLDTWQLVDAQGAIVAEYEGI